ncbi:L10-interacting MYB domain-containing protein-like [Eucalyptus grandis]|uniref:L10-interacting MYB domain-containing protein-like n=1 Tax=Eucalyptus grandis TaxID=71139 RepID=UPI00192EBBF8|nr:L10-interacting MYB domain-containing protein-like [Eucalyptus grandis]
MSHLHLFILHLLVDGKFIKEKAFWSPEDVETFCKLCVEQIDNDNRPANNKIDGWTVIIKKFEDLKGKKYDKGQMKSKWDNLKEDWKRLRTLILKETGLGWDPKKNTIDASDEWWERKIQENLKVRHFRMKGIHPDLQVLLDRMFGDTVATGSITWNPTQGLHIDENVVAAQFDIGGSAGAGFTDDNIEDDVGEKSSEQHRSDKRTSQSSLWMALLKEKTMKKRKKNIGNFV